MNGLPDRSKRLQTDGLDTNKNIIVNLGSEKGISVKEMLESARKITGKSIPSEIVNRREGDSANLYATSKKGSIEIHFFK